jgi:hypothetical protein
MLIAYSPRVKVNFQGLRVTSDGEISLEIVAMISSSTCLVVRDVAYSESSMPL